MHFIYFTIVIKDVLCTRGWVKFFLYGFCCIKCDKTDIIASILMQFLALAVRNIFKHKIKEVPGSQLDYINSNQKKMRTLATKKKIKS